MNTLGNFLGACGLAVAPFLRCTPCFRPADLRHPRRRREGAGRSRRQPRQGACWTRIFGPGGQDLLSSGDPAVDKQRIADFLALAGKGSAVADGDAGHKALVFGTKGWRFPIPLQQKAGGWTFDLAAGKQAIIDRRVGVNELAAIGVCADYVAAQNEYRSRLHDDEPVPQYARRLLSSPGRNDGLYWPPANAADRSPLGDRIAGAVDDGGDGKPRSYRGYEFRILTAQGPDAPGGAYDYMVKGRLLAGFALIADAGDLGPDRHHDLPLRPAGTGLGAQSRRALV